MSSGALSNSNMPTLSRSVILGVGAGLAGGLVFGVMMAAMGMLPMVGMLVGQDNAVIGFVVHMAISAFIGATFGLIAPRLPASWTARVIGGGIYGIVWWVLGALILMPLMLGMSQMVFVIEQMQINSLIGHILFGVVMGAAFKALSERL